jgi:hypothetical protein
MIARFRILLPYEFQIPQGAELQPHEFTYSGYRVTVYPPLQVALPPGALEASFPILSEDVLEQLVSVNPPEVNHSIRINGVPTIRANMLQIDFHKNEFFRSRQDPQAGADEDPPSHLIFELVNTTLSSLRSITQASHIKSLNPESTLWRLDYLTDDLEELQPTSDKIHRRVSANFRWQICGVNREVWDKVRIKLPAYRPPNWETLILDAESLLPDVGPSLVLAATALETLISVTLDHLTAESDLPKKLWQWINNRGDYRKEPSVEEQFDVLLKVLTNKSLKEESQLWEGFKNLKTARNSFVHDGKAAIGGREVTKDQAYSLVGRAREIADWLEALLPSDWRRSTLDTEMKFQASTVIIGPPAPGG